MADVSDYNQLFRALLEFKWRDVAFPVVDFDLELVQDQVVHKFADRDGAHVEATGRAPFRINARIPFLVGLSKGPHETWTSQLYPTAWRAFFAACADRSSGPLQHPELGPLTCKCERAVTKWEAGVRAGVYVTASWIETDDSQTDLTHALQSASPLAGLSTATVDLDAQVAGLNPSLFPQPYVPPVTFESLMADIRGVVDTVTLTQMEIGGRINGVLYQAQALEDACNRAANANALNWPIIQSCELAKANAYDLQSSQLQKSKAIGFYTVVKDSTMAQIAANLGADVIDILTLNTGYAGLIVIPSGAIVRYYQ